MRTLLRSTVNDPNSAANFNTSQLHYLAIRLEMLCSRGALWGPVALLPQLENPVGRAISDSRTANAS